MNAYTVGGILAGVFFGFFIGRWWAEYFRAARDARNLHATRQNYRGQVPAAWYAGAALIGIGLFWFAYAA